MSTPAWDPTLVEAAAGAWRPRDPDGRVLAHPAWSDLGPEGRVAAYEASCVAREVEAATDAAGWSATVRAVMGRIAGSTS